MKPNPPRPRPPGHTGNRRPPTNRQPHQPSPRTTANPTSAPTKPENASRPPTGQTATAKNCTTLKTAHTYPTPGKQPPLILPQPATNDQRQPNPKKRTPDLTRHQLNHRPPMDRGPGQLSGGLTMKPNPPRPFPHRKPPPAHQPATPPTFTQDDSQPTRRPTHPGQTRNLLSHTNRPNRNNGQNTHHAKNRPPHTTQPENTHRPPTNREPGQLSGRLAMKPNLPRPRPPANTGNRRPLTNREPRQPSPRTTANPTSALAKPENTSPRSQTGEPTTTDKTHTTLKPAPHITHNRETPTAHPPPARNKRQVPSNPKKRTPDSTRRRLKPPPAREPGIRPASRRAGLGPRRPRPYPPRSGRPTTTSERTE